MAQIFLSYSHSDSDFVELIEPRIQRIFGEGLLWYDRKPDGLKGGQIWWTEIRRQIQECQIFLFLLSDESAVSGNCTEELREALALNKTIIPVLLETYSSKDYPVTYSQEFIHRLDEIQYVDLRNARKRKEYDDLSELWGAINRAQKTSLSRTERWLLWNQYEIIKMLQFGKDHERMVETSEQRGLSSGFEYQYNQLSSRLEDNTMSSNDGKEVHEILDMFHDLHVALELRGLRNADLNLTDEQFGQLKFGGFFTNVEQHHASYVRFLFCERNYYPFLLPEDGRLDAFEPMIPVHREMLREWRTRKGRIELTEDDVIHIANAASY